jgi:hypothetical protein
MKMLKSDGSLKLEYLLFPLILGSAPKDFVFIPNDIVANIYPILPHYTMFTLRNDVNFILALLILFLPVIFGCH